VDERAGEVRERIEASPYPFGLVTSPSGVLLGRLRRSMLECDPSLPAGDVMEPGPSTVRPDRRAARVVERLAERDLRWAVITTPEGRLVGVAARQDLERAAEADDN
jgi:CBS domain-containing protein